MRDYARESSTDGYSPLAIDVFTSIVLHLSSQTLEHTVTALTKCVFTLGDVKKKNFVIRYAPIFRELIPTTEEDAQMKLLNVRNYPS